MRKFYFNTGIKPWNMSHKRITHNMEKGNIFINNELHIPFECDVEESAKVEFMFACNNANHPESKSKNVLVKEIFNSNLVTKYAFFKVCA